MIPNLEDIPPEIIESLKKNEDKIKEVLPETWTHVANLNPLVIGFRFKLLGLDWRSNDEFGMIMVLLERVGILLRDGVLVRRSLHTAFSDKIT